MSDYLPDIQRALKTLCVPGEVYELRALEVPAGRYNTRVESGYFDDPDEFAKQASFLTERGAKAVYYTPNPCLPDLLARRVNRVGSARRGELTTDQDIVRRHWFLVDVDPVRPAGISSTEEEHIAALELAEEIAKAKMAQGWPEPVRGDSGNGAHLMWRVDEPNNDATTKLFQQALKAFEAEFATDKLSIDQTVYNAGRIWKVPGTVARKGDSTDSRPHRIARLISAPDSPQLLQRAMLEALTRAEEQAATARFEASEDGFDIEQFIATHFNVSSESTSPGMRIWKLSPCPMNGDHVDGAAIMQMDSGAIAFKCHHNGCAGVEWSDVRSAYDQEYKERLEQPVLSDEDIEAFIAGSKPIVTQSTPGFRLFRGDEAELADKLIFVLGGKQVLVSDAGRVYRYSDGIWRHIPTEALKSEIKSWSGQMVGKGEKKHPLNVSHAKASGTIALLVADLDRSEHAEDHKSSFFDKAARACAFANGTVVARTSSMGKGYVELVEHSPEHRLRHRFEFDYEPPTKAPERFSDYLSSVFPEDPIAQQLLYQVVGSAVLGLGPWFGKAFFLFGIRGTGKSTFLEIVEGCMPPRSVVSVGPQEMAERFERVRLDGPLLNSVHEVDSSEVMRDNDFKSIVQGQQVNGARKYAQSYEFRPRCLHLMAGNSLPSAPGVSDAYWDRWLPIRLTVRHRDTQHEIPDYSSLILEEELPLIIAKAIELIGKALSEGRGKHYKMPEESLKLLKKWKAEADSVGWFIENTDDFRRAEPEERRQDWANRAEVYRVYRSFCGEEGFRAVSSREFYRRLENHDVEAARVTGFRRVSLIRVSNNII